VKTQDLPRDEGRLQEHHYSVVYRSWANVNTVHL